MPTIKDFRPSISAMSTQEAYDLIRDTRALRREPKPKKPRALKQSSQKARKIKKQASIEDLLDTMSPEKLRALAERLKK